MLRGLARTNARLVGLRDLVVIFMPGSLGRTLRLRHYRSRLKSLGANVRIDAGVQIVNPACVSIGDNTWIDNYVILLAGPPHIGARKLSRKENANFEHAEGELVIGSHVHVASHVVIIAHGGVRIGDYSGVAAGAQIISLSHHYRNSDDPDDEFLYRFTPMAPEEEQALIAGPVVMEENSALATNAVMLPGSTIGRNTWVSIGSLVMGEIPADVIAGGSPAAVLKKRSS